MVWAAVVLVAFFILLRQRLEIRVVYRDEAGDRGLEVTLTAFGGRALYRSARPARDVPQGALATAVTTLAESWVDVPGALHRWATQIRQAEEAMTDYQVVVNYLRRRVIARRIAAELTLGTGQVVSTGVAVGAAWATMGILGARLSRVLPAGSGRPSFKVIPDYQRRAFRASLDCIFAVRAGHIIGAAVRVWKAERARRHPGRSG